MSSETRRVRAPDGADIAYDVTGEGPPLILLHAGFVADRKRWHELGYVARLATDFQVITLDLRGHGESDQPTDPAQFGIEQVIADVLAVADACDAPQFLLWGFSYGGNVARYLAAMTDRAIKVVIGGIPLTRALPAEFVRAAISKWQPIADAQLAGTFDPATLSLQEREFATRTQLLTVLALIRAMDGWPLIGPTDLRCPALLYAGTENQDTIEWVQQHEREIDGTRLRVDILPGLNHRQEFTEIAVVFPIVHAFLLNAD